MMLLTPTLLFFKDEQDIMWKRRENGSFKKKMTTKQPNFLMIKKKAVMISYTTTRYFQKKKAKFSSNIHSYKSASKSLKKLYLIKRQEFDNNVLLLSYKKYTGHFSRIFCLYFYLFVSRPHLFLPI